MKLLTFILTCILLSGCGSQSLEDYKDKKPTLDLREFFKGDIEAVGIVQDRAGVVKQRFRADILASWKGDMCTLDETFYYPNQPNSKRIWKLREVSINNYKATAGDVVGEATGEVRGNAFYFEYVLEVDIDGSKYHIAVEDWMYHLDKNTLMARSYMTKWGFDVGEVSLIMTKKN